MAAKSFFNGYLSKAEHRATPFTSLSNDLDKLLFQMPAASVKAHLRMNAIVSSVSSYVYGSDVALIDVGR